MIKVRSETSGTLALGEAVGFKGTIEGFAGADAIDLLGYVKGGEKMLVLADLSIVGLTEFGENSAMPSWRCEWVVRATTEA